jgi:type IV fimbrial biogenesis protein FimT
MKRAMALLKTLQHWTDQRKTTNSGLLKESVTTTNTDTVRTAKHSTGTSLVEILICVFVLALLLRTGIPDLLALVTATRSQSALTTIHDAILLARSQAILDRTTVTVCGSDDQLRCGRNWNTGLLLFKDTDSDGSLGENETVIATKSWLDSQGNIRWRAFQNRRVLQLGSTGFTRHQNGNFTFCPANGNAREARQLVVSRTARLRFARDSDGDGMIEGSNGKPVTCP